MKVKDLYKICQELINRQHGEYDITIEVGNPFLGERELIVDNDVKEFSKDIGLLILKPYARLTWS